MRLPTRRISRFTSSVDEAAMGCGNLLPSFLLLYITLLFVHGQGPVGGHGADDCCPFIMVNVGGAYQDLDGEYTLKAKQDLKPDEICLNGCIYSKKDDPDDFCFRMDEEFLADVECPVRIHLSITSPFHLD